MHRPFAWASSTRRSIVAIAFALSALAAPLHAAAPSIHDGAGLFSPAAISRARDLIDDIEQRYRVPIVVDTFSSVPWLARVWHNLKDPTARKEYVTTWARHKARRAGSQGLYVLFCKEPPPAQVVVIAGPDLQALASDDVAKLQRILAGGFNGNGQDDRGLREGLDFLRETLQAKLGAGVALPEPFPWGDVLGIVAILVAFWLCIEGIHAIAVARTADRPDPVDLSAQSGGSLATALFTALTLYGFRGIVHALLATRSSVLPPVPAELPTTSELEDPAAPPAVGPTRFEQAPTSSPRAVPPEP